VIDVEAYTLPIRKRCFLKDNILRDPTKNQKNLKIKR